MQHATTLASPGRARTYGALALQIILALAFLAAGAAKLAGVPMMVQLFDAIGLGQWFRIATGLVEVVGAIGLLVPGFAGPAALWLGFTMACATITHLAVLHTNPAPAVVLVVLNAFLAYLRREQVAAFLARRGQVSSASA